ncbi:MAG: PH domain-containing protein [Kutzneria sp.]|nr:PH domain-containing protein [Kutzneria sp.]
MTGIGLRAPRQTVSRRAIPYWTVRALLGWLVLAGVQCFLLVVRRGPFGAHSPAVLSVTLAVTIVLAIAHLLVMPRWRFRVHRWEITPTAVYTQSGWFDQEWRIAPISRIQTVDTERGPLEQLFGLAKVTVTTASAAGPLHIKVLDTQTAQRVAEDLAAAAGLGGGDAT